MVKEVIKSQNNSLDKYRKKTNISNENLVEELVSESEQQIHSDEFVHNENEVT